LIRFRNNKSNTLIMSLICPSRATFATHNWGKENEVL